MKRFFLSLLLIGLAFSVYYIHDKTYYKDGVDFLCPLGAEALRLRYDEYGDGHYGAKRKDGRTHNGIDVLTKAGEPVLATKSGWAISKLDLDGYGNYVEIYHRDGFISRYGHLEAVGMRWIRKVRQGDVIGWAGKSGNARYAGMKTHLHFEIRRDGMPVDPGIYMSEPITK